MMSTASWIFSSKVAFVSPSRYPTRVWRGVLAAGWRSLAGATVVATLSIIGGGAALLTISGKQSPGAWILLGALGVGLVVALHLQQLPSARKGRLGRTTVRIEVGDLFDGMDHIVIPVNEFFDSELGDRVAPRSLHGQAIQKLFDCDSQKFRAATDLSLSQAQVTPLSAATDDGRPRYEIGTTAVVDAGGRRLFLTALTHTDVATRKASADIDDLLKTLASLWNTVRDRCNGEQVRVPVIGAGLAQVPLSTRGLLQMLLLSVERASLERAISNDGLTIVLTDDAFGEVDLRDLTLD